MSKTTTYRFTFKNPIKFKRVYNFLSPFAPSNNFWIPPDSSIKHITTLKSKTKNTLVNILIISFDRIIGGERFYAATLVGNNNTDTFKISEENVVEFLELFELK